MIQRSENVRTDQNFARRSGIFGFNPIENIAYLKSFNKRVLVLSKVNVGHNAQPPNEDRNTDDSSLCPTRQFNLNQP